MKKTAGIIITVCYILVATPSYSKIDLKNKNFKKHEINLNINYAYHNSIINNMGITIRGIEDESVILNYYDFRNIILQGIGLKFQYNYFIKKRIYVGASINTAFYFPQTLIYDLTDALNKIPPGGTRPIITDEKNKVELTYNAEKFYGDFGIGFLLVYTKKFNWRIATGLGIGYLSYHAPFSIYGNLAVLSSDSTYYNYHYKFSQNKYDLVQGFIWGGYLESSLNFVAIKEKLELGLNYKFLFGKVPFGLTFPHDVGLTFNIKLK